MIAKLTGSIESYGKDWLILETHDVGYFVHCPSKTVDDLGVSSTKTVSLWIDTIIRDERIHLYGFVSLLDRDCFRLLLTVQGVGSKVALNLISDLSTPGLLSAIARQDKEALCRAEGVGAKLAARLLLELKEKYSALLPAGTLPQELPAESSAQVLSDVLAALTHLGYSQNQAYEALRQIDASRFSDTTALIRACLQTLDRPAAAL